MSARQSEVSSRLSSKVTVFVYVVLLVQHVQIVPGETGTDESIVETGRREHIFLIGQR